MIRPDEGAGAESSADLTAEECLVQALERLRDAKVPAGAKCLVIFLADAGEQYNVGFHSAGLKRSEIVALAEVIKGRMLSALLGANTPFPT